ncbi:hypothetical protein [Persicitalea jodogahamensis]|uniref:Uncharacterized protein n=1 Tax=Persicitalea jodogahamensis TaxID=402147 RepID=A0A8J3D5P7_9BACT|nr:hypothetical protein [Persicitalea jodogahamensis]GHB86769.1 hypothetical protein GCM10007390_48090 [Persicitalea jodogahamensis]
MRFQLIRSLLFAFLLIPFFVVSQPVQQNKRDYLYYVQTFADTLLATGLDTYGPVVTPMWAGVMDARDRTVPIRGVPPTQGVRPSDRAVGGANYYHDVLTLSVFDRLTKLTGDSKYQSAANNYSQTFLAQAQHPATGLLGWGEHLYYNFFTDTVSMAESRMIDQMPGFQMPHELIEWTPPWSRLWEADPALTRRAIEGLRYHFTGPDPQTNLFNRHAIWNKATYQKVIMPWIKHSALYAYSYAFLYQKTGDAAWKEKSWQIGTLYWNLRDHRTNLVLGCLYHATEPEAGKTASLSNTALYAYWLFKAGELCGSDEMKQQAIAVLVAYDKFGWNEENKRYFSEVNLDGSPIKGAAWSTPWKEGYGTSSLLTLSRAAAYMAERGGADELIPIVKKSLTIANGQPLPEIYNAQNLGEAIHAYVEGYELTKDKAYLDQARKYADLAIAGLWKEGLFVRQKGDFYYEAKLGTGDLISGLLRLHESLSGKPRATSVDWSF